MYQVAAAAFFRSRASRNCSVHTIKGQAMKIEDKVAMTIPTAIAAAKFQICDVPKSNTPSRDISVVTEVLMARDKVSLMEILMFIRMPIFWIMIILNLQ